MSLKGLNRNGESSSLLFRDEREDEPESGGVSLLVIGLVAVIFAFLGMVTIGAVTYKVFIDEPATTTTTSTTSTTTTSTTTTSTTTSTTTTTTSTTTTTLCGGSLQPPCKESNCNEGYVIGTIGVCQPCGGEFQPPCEDGNCSKGFMLGSMGLCQPIECNPSVPSGKNGCGEWALNFCR